MTKYIYIDKIFCILEKIGKCLPHFQVRITTQIRHVYMILHRKKIFNYCRSLKIQ